MTVIKAMKRMPGLWWPVVILLVLLVLNAAPVAAENQVFVLKIEGTITAGQLNFIKRQIQAAEEVGADLLVIVLNTPGGIVDATLEINEAFLNARVPVAVFVAPAGAIAGSAGAFIVVSSDIAAMAPGTTIGAAHPVALTPEGTTAADEKTTKFLAGHIKSLAREKGRPTDVAEKFVTENLSISSREALEKGLIEYLVHDLDELLDVLDG
nr:ATP-dependent Clp protease proteolytic subunit [Bacillota bacterium]